MRNYLSNQHALPSTLFPEQVSYTALGHLHLAQAVGGNESVRYSGSPIPLSFDEQHYQHQIIQVDIQADKSIQTKFHCIPRSVEILRIPSAKGFCELETALEQLQTHKFDYSLSLEQQPVLELRIALEKPEPGLRQQIEQCVTELPVRLLKISTAYSGSEKGLADVLEEERLEELAPEQVFQQCYKSKFDKQVPDNLLALFHELQEQVQGSE